MWWQRLAALIVAIATASCASSSFEASWRAPEATPLHVDGSKVAAIAMMRTRTTNAASVDRLVATTAKRVAKELERQGLLSPSESI